MAPRPFEVLNAKQAQHFIEKGYVRVKGCLDPGLAPGVKVNTSSF